MSEAAGTARSGSDDAILRAFPSRSIRLPPPQKMTAGRMIFLLLFCVFFVGGGAWLAVTDFNGIMYDSKIAHDPIEDDQASVSGTCNAELMIVTCTSQIGYQNPGSDATINIERSATFFDWSPDNESTTVLRLRTDPTMVTDSLGVQTIPNRITLLVVIPVVLLLIIGIASIIPLKRRKLARSGVELPMVPLIGDVSYMRRLGIVKVVHNGRKVTGNFAPSVFQPFFVDPAKKRALTALVEGTKILIPLNEDLTTLDLTESERRALVAARGNVLKR